MDEEELIKKLINQDEAAFRFLMKTNKAQVLNTCFKFLHSQSDAEDALQEVFIEIFRSINKFKGASSLNTWIYRITVNKCIDIIRAGKRKKALASIISIFSDEYKNSKEREIDINAIRSDMEVNEELLLIMKAIGKLPENQRIAITLCRLDGLSGAEAAEILGTTIGAVEALLHRAKKNLIKYLAIA